MRRTLAAVVALPLLAVLVPTAATAAPCRAAPASVRLSADHATGGASLTGTVRLTCRTERRVRVQLAGFAGVSVPASVTVRADRRSASFPVATVAAAEVRSGTIVATRRGRTAGAALTVDATPTPVVPTAPVVPPPPPPVTPPPVPPPLTGDGGLVSATVRESDKTRWSRQRVVDFVFDWPMYEPLADGVFIRMTSSAPEIIQSQFIDVTRNPDYEYIAATPPEVDTLVTLTFTLGTSSVTATTLASPLPTEVTGGLDLYWFSLPGRVVSGDEEELRAQIDVPAPSGTWVDVTSSHPAVWAPRSVEFYTEDYWESTRGTFGPVSEPTTVTLTGTVRGTAITGSVDVIVYPGVAAVEAPTQVTSGVPFEATVRMQGPAPFDRSLSLGGAVNTCSPGPATLPAGATSLILSCVPGEVTSSRTVALGVSEDGTARGSTLVTVLPAP